MFRKNLKYKNIIVKIDGVKVADSKKEYKRELELKLLEERGLIKNLHKQVWFVITEAFIDSFGGDNKASHYVADFTYHCLQTNRLICEDVKSAMTVKLPLYILKKKLFKIKYPQYYFFENYKKSTR